MEVKFYLRMLQRSWWIVMVSVLAAMVIALITSYMTMPIYQTTARFIVSPNSTLITGGNNVLNSLATLDKRSIITTYAEILNSSRIYQETTDLLKLSAADLANYTHTTVVLPDTNILELSVEGPNPSTVAALANSIGQRAVEYTQGFYQVYDLNLLDPATPPVVPIRPQPVRDTGIAIVLGLAVGVALALVRELLRTPLESFLQQSTLDGVSLAFSRRTFERRLEESTAAVGATLSLCLVELQGLSNYIEMLPQPILQDVLRNVTQTLKNQLRGNDIVGRWDDDRFAVLLSETGGRAAINTMGRVRNVLSEPITIQVSGEKLLLQPVIGVAEHKSGEIPSNLVKNTEVALERAAQTPEHLFLM